MAVKALADGTCFADSKEAPPVYYIGPLITKLQLSVETKIFLENPPFVSHMWHIVALNSAPLGTRSSYGVMGTVSIIIMFLWLSQYKSELYYFFASGAAILALFSNFPKLHEETSLSFKDMVGVELHVPASAPLKAMDMIEPMLERDDHAY
ncbi:hypothetical protein JHK86_009740 [Glycine max]|nr:hypothetical protein JHK86_009740 [Glycine max]